MPELVQFSPIFRNSPEDIKDYYTKNNLSFPENTFFKRYLNVLEDTSPEVTWNIPKQDKTKYPDFLSKKQSVLPKKDGVKAIASKITQKDYTLNPEKSLIIKEIADLNYSDEDKDYLYKMAERESSFRPNIKNQFGYFGLYQFGEDALTDAGYSKDDFKDTKNQHKAALALASVNETRLRPIIDAFIGKEKGGVKITKNGIRAAAHLLGAGTVKDWFLGTTNSKFAKNGFVDGNGTHITEYLKMFA